MYASENTMESENPVTAARNRIIGATKAILAEADRVRAIADTMFGQEGSPQGIATPAQPPRCGEAGILHDEIDSLELALSSLNSEVGRLTPLSFSAPRATAPSAGNSRRI